ncbi:MAG: undecaprenyldiphospho-muramoylpentapeptide beta-N-acetylglucosaminyltransferase [bacterium]
MAARVIVMAGGTGGHVFPALAVAEELQTRGWEVTWLGTPDSFESRVIPKKGFPLKLVNSFRLRGQRVTDLLFAPFRLVRACAQAWAVLREVQPNVVLGMGGFVTGPGGICAVIMRLPLVIHEQNALPGMTNRWLSRVASSVLEAFPGSFPASRQAKDTGNPVRKEIVALAEHSAAEESHQPIRVLVLGGSLGALALNETVPQSLAAIDGEHLIEVRHQAGRDKADVAREAYGRVSFPAQVTEFIDDMAEAYEWADVVICRAGALTVSELAIAGVASILVPYPYAVDDHQTVNASFLVNADAGILMPQEQMSVTNLKQQLEALFSNPARIQSMGQAARRVGRPNATHQVADICEEVRAA